MKCNIEDTTLIQIYNFTFACFGWCCCVLLLILVRAPTNHFFFALKTRMSTYLMLHTVLCVMLINMDVHMGHLPVGSIRWANGFRASSVCLLACWVLLYIMPHFIHYIKHHTLLCSLQKSLHPLWHISSEMPSLKHFPNLLQGHQLPAEQLPIFMLLHCSLQCPFLFCFITSFYLFAKSNSQPKMCWIIQHFNCMHFSIIH